MKKGRRDTARSKYAAMEKGAALRGIEFDITFPEYGTRYFEKPCYYCGRAAIGLDRICSANGYNIENVVACCTTCNMMKGVLERDAFLTHCRRITENHSEGMGSISIMLQRAIVAQGSLNHQIDQTARDIITQTLIDHNGNQVLAAKQLHIPRTTLRNRIKKLGIST